MSIYEELLARYEAGDTPWDAELPPPEVVETVAGLTPGRALDLGCGYGRAAIYLARLGWAVDGVDFIALAIERARERAQAAGVRARFHVASATALDFLVGPYDFALDVGCLHALEEAEIQAYCGELRRLLRPGAIYLLFARLRTAETPAEGSQPGLDESWLGRTFAPDFALLRVERGMTHMADGASWASGWYWFHRPDVTLET